MDYQRAAKMFLDAREKERNDLKLEAEKEREEFFNSPSFDKHRYDSMLNQFKEFVNTADFTKEVVFVPPADETTYGWFFTVKDVHPWWRCEERQTNDKDNPYFVRFGVINSYAHYVFEEARKQGFDVICSYVNLRKNRYLVRPKIDTENTGV